MAKINLQIFNEILILILGWEKKVVQINDVLNEMHYPLHTLNREVLSGSSVITDNNFFTTAFQDF